MSFAENVKRICKEKGIKINDLAERLEIHPISVSRAINQDYPQLQTVERIAKALEVTPKEILFGPELPTPTPAHYCPHCGKEIRIQMQAVITAAPTEQQHQQQQPNTTPGTTDQHQHNNINPSLWD